MKKNRDSYVREMSLLVLCVNWKSDSSIHRFKSVKYLKNKNITKRKTVRFLTYNGFKIDWERYNKQIYGE